jgi:hypothetical protein
MWTHYSAAGGQPTPGTLNHCGVTSSKRDTYALRLSVYFIVFNTEKFLSLGTQIYIFLVTNNEHVSSFIYKN